MQKTINGIVYGWGSLRIIHGNRVFPTVQEISYDELQDSKWVYGQGEHMAPIARTAGKYSASPSKFKMLVSDADELREYLASFSDSGTSYGETQFNISVQGRQKGLPERNDVLANCSYRSTNGQFKNDNEELVEEILVNTQWIERNGLVIFPDSMGRPDAYMI